MKVKLNFPAFKFYKRKEARIITTVLLDNKRYKNLSALLGKKSLPSLSFYESSTEYTTLTYEKGDFEFSS